MSPAHNALVNDLQITANRATEPMKIWWGAKTDEGYLSVELHISRTKNFTVTMLLVNTDKPERIERVRVPQEVGAAASRCLTDLGIKEVCYWQQDAFERFPIPSKRKLF